MKQTALLVGINRYDDDAIVDLAYAEQDARELYAFLKRTALYDEVRHLPASEANEDRILDAAADLTQHLDVGDLFVFYFAGHGVQHQGRHLLLCPQVRFHRLEFGHHAVPVDLLKKETARSGVSRVFVLDACRGNLLAAREGTPQGFRGARGLRDIVCSAPPQEGPLSILCSCDEGRQAQELPRLEQGLFSRALLEEFESAASEGGELRLDDRLEHALSERMSRLARAHDLPLLDQRPWIQRSGETPALLSGRRRELPTPDLSPGQAKAPAPPPVPPANRTPEVEPASPPPRPSAGPPLAPDKPVVEPLRFARLTLRSERRWIEEDAVYSVLVDGVEAGRLSNGGVGSFSVGPGRHTLAVKYSSYPRTLRRHVARQQYSSYSRTMRGHVARQELDVSAAPIDLDLDAGIERVVDCDVNELSWLMAVPGLHVIMLLLLQFTPCRWLQLRQTATCLPVPPQAQAKPPPAPPPAAPLVVPPPPLNQSSAANDKRPVSPPPAPPGPPRPAPANQSSAPPVRALKAHRGGTILALGMLGFFTFGLAGISAWVEGNKDLKEMSARIMDPRGWRLTSKGRNLGIASTIFWGVILLHGLTVHHFLSRWFFFRR